jgi:hypothetical protein
VAVYDSSLSLKRLIWNNITKKICEFHYFILATIYSCHWNELKSSLSGNLSARNMKVWNLQIMRYSPRQKLFYFCKFQKGNTIITLRMSPILTFYENYKIFIDFFINNFLWYHNRETSLYIAKSENNWRVSHAQIYCPVSFH